MSVNLEPLRYDWPSVQRGDTFPAINFTDTGADANLSRVRVKICDSNGTVKITLDSNTSGVTINTATAGAWDFTIDAISAATTEALVAGAFAYDLETTDANSVVRTEFEGTWQVDPQITDA
jgi:hypothetical protein